MVTAFNEKTVTAQPFETGVTRQRLVTNERVKGTRVLLDRHYARGRREHEVRHPAKIPRLDSDA